MRAALPIPVLAALASGCDGAPRESAESMPVTRVVRDLLAEPPAWASVRARADGARTDGAPGVGVISPAFDGTVDGADMPALVMPPPCEVALVLPEDAAGARLRARAGVDLGVFQHLPRDAPEATVVFEVLDRGRPLVRAEVRLHASRRHENVWADVGGEDGVEIEDGMELALRTELLASDGSPFDVPIAVRAGFGGLRLERTETRRRTLSSPEHPSIVLVVMDTLRADRLSTYGYARPTSPVLTELAARGVLFESGHAASSWTWPSTASILTGLTPMEHGLVGEGSSFLAEDVSTLTEELQAAGFTTAAWSGNPIVTPQRNLDQGFEEFHHSSDEFRKTDRFFGEVRDFLRRRAGTRFFLYLHLVEPHGPLVPLEEGARLLAPGLPAGAIARSDELRHALSRGAAVRPGGTLDFTGLATPEEREQASALYDACVWSGDHWLGELLGTLRELGLEDETIVAFTSDHGEELFERGFFGHGQSLRQELVHVPLVVAGPLVPVGRRVSAPTSNRLLARYLALLARGGDTGQEEAERRLAALQEGGPVLFSTTKGWWKGRNRVSIVGLRDGEWKLDLALDGAAWGAAEPAPAGDLELFSLSRDPREEQGLAPTDPAQAERLRALLLNRVRELESRRIGTALGAGEATLQLLEQLGYGGEDS